jgi:hypothetical protein
MYLYRNFSQEALDSLSVGDEFEIISIPSSKRLPNVTDGFLPVPDGHFTPGSIWSTIMNYNFNRRDLDSIGYTTVVSRSPKTITWVRNPLRPDDSDHKTIRSNYQWFSRYFRPTLTPITTSPHLLIIKQRVVDLDEDDNDCI